MFEPPDILTFIKTLRDYGGYEFSNYSDKSFMRRVEKILMDNRIDLKTLISRVKFDHNFLEEVVKDITVNNTELFRDPQVWHAIKYRILPRLASKREINIWHAGCSTGQEVYSMIILLNELGMLYRSHIYATDSNTDVLKTAHYSVKMLSSFSIQSLTGMVLYSVGVARITTRSMPALMI